MANLNMPKTDYEKPRSRFAEEYLTKLKMLYDQRSEESKEAGSLRRQKMEQDVRNQPKEDPYKQMQIDLQRDKLAEQKSQNEKKLAQAELSRISRVMDNPKMSDEQKAEALGKQATSKEERSAWNPARWFGDKEGFSKEKFNQQVSDRVQQLEAVVAGEEASPSQPQPQQQQQQPRQADPNTALRNILSKKRQ